MPFELEVDGKRRTFKPSEAEKLLDGISVEANAIVISPSGDRWTVAEARIHFRSVEVKAEG